jgi:hypothetical protein
MPERYIKAHLSIHVCELNRKVIGVDDSEIYKVTIDTSCESKYALYRDIQVYLEPVTQDIEALGYSWRLKNC